MIQVYPTVFLPSVAWKGGEMLVLRGSFIAWLCIVYFMIVVDGRAEDHPLSAYLINSMHTKGSKVSEAKFLSGSHSDSGTSSQLTDHIKLRGFIESMAGTDIQRDEPNEHQYDLRNLFKLEGVLDTSSSDLSRSSASGKRFQGLLSVQGDYLWMGPDHDYEDFRLDLHEAALLLATDRYDVKLGKQIVRWGKTDQVSPVDNLNPQDLRQLNLRELEDRKIPIWMARGRLFSGNHTVEGVYIPWFEPARIDYFDSDWAVYRQIRADVKDGPLPPAMQSYLLSRNVLEEEPAKILRNSEFGGRVTTALSAWDVGLSYLYGWENTPYFSSFPIKNLNVAGGFTSENLLAGLSGAVLTDTPIQVEYLRQSVVGAEFETTVGQLGLRGEAAYFNRVSFLARNLTSIHHPVFHYVLGMDYSSPSDWYANLQWSHQIMGGSDEQILYVDRNDLALLAELSQALWRGQLTVGVKGSYNLGNGSFYLQPEIILKKFKNIELFLGANIFEGDGDSVWGLYDKNDQLFFRFIYYL